MAPLDPTFVNACKVISLISFAASIAWFVMVVRREAATAAKPGAMPTRPVPPLPRATPANSSTTKVSAAAVVNAGMAGHQQRSLAKTAKLPVADRVPVVPTPPVAAPKPAPASAPVKTGDDDEAMNTLFAGVAAPGLTPAEEAERKVSRLQELGFHHSISPSDSAASPAAPRTKTAELNAILERIDQFLADEPKDGAKDGAKDGYRSGLNDEATEEIPPRKTEVPAKQPDEAVDTQAKTEPLVATKPVEAKTDQAKTTPLWARPDAVDEDVSKIDKPAEGEQQRLF